VAVRSGVTKEVAIEWKRIPAWPVLTDA
jgi:hypothetical protein